MYSTGLMRIQGFAAYARPAIVMHIRNRTDATACGNHLILVLELHNLHAGGFISLLHDKSLLLPCVYVQAVRIDGMKPS